MWFDDGPGVVFRVVTNRTISGGKEEVGGAGEGLLYYLLVAFISVYAGNSPYIEGEAAAGGPLVS